MASDPGTGSPLFWRQLFSDIRDRKLIPVVGQDAVVVEDERGRCTLNEYVARRVERNLNLPPTEGDQPVTLHDVACRFLEHSPHPRMGTLYSEVREVLREEPVPIPDSIRKLARIDAFSLYVTTTFDDLLQRAIDEERYGGRPATQSLMFSRDRSQDLRTGLSELGTPVVYHLLGRLSTIPDYAVTEEDTLEFVLSLESEKKAPRILLDELSRNSLLVIGSGYSDWLMRFFLRVARRERLLLARTKTYVSDARVHGDASLSRFLRLFSAETNVYQGDALSFIDELAERWEEQRGDDASPSPSDVSGRAGPPPDPIFLSYASEDYAAAAQLAEALREAKLPVWFDKLGGLEGGDEYRPKILAQIRDASLFVPVVSEHALTPRRRFFKLEWNEAIKVSAEAFKREVFIVPVRVDDVPIAADAIPEEIRALHWLDGRDGLDAVVRAIRDRYRAYQLALSGAA